MPCIIDAIWGKINFLGISVVKTHCVLGQKSQNSAQYAGTFGGNNHFVWEKSQKSALYYRHYLREKIIYFWNLYKLP